MKHANPCGPPRPGVTSWKRTGRPSRRTPFRLSCGIVAVNRPVRQEGPPRDRQALPRGGDRPGVRAGRPWRFFESKKNLRLIRGDPSCETGRPGYDFRRVDRRTSRPESATPTPRTSARRRSSRSASPPTRNTRPWTFAGGSVKHVSPTPIVLCHEGTSSWGGRGRQIAASTR